MLETKKHSPFFQRLHFTSLLSMLCFAHVDLVIYNCYMLSPKLSLWGLELYAMCDFQPSQRHVMTQKSDIPAEQLGPNTLSSAQFSQAVPPNPSCRTPRERMLDLSRLCYPSLVSISLSNIPSLCACPEAPFSFFLALFVL